MFYVPARIVVALDSKLSNDFCPVGRENTSTTEYFGMEFKCNFPF